MFSRLRGDIVLQKKKDINLKYRNLKTQKESTSKKETTTKSRCNQGDRDLQLCQRETRQLYNFDIL